MNARVRSLGQEARTLSAEERLELVDDILSSLGPPDPDIEAAWSAEAQDRLSAWRRGELAAVPADEVFARYLKA